MFILTQDEKMIINADTDIVIFMNCSNSADVPIFAKVPMDEKPYKLGRYASIEEAKKVIVDLGQNLNESKKCYFMPLSRIVAPEYQKQDARQKRKGGS